MALTDQPYLPLYINDWMTSMKLRECTIAAHGLMINIMTIMHKSEDYGIILLKQKYKQNEDQIHNFALQLAKNLPFTLDDIGVYLRELILEEVLKIDGEKLICKRMVRDAHLSMIRATSGRKGGKATQQNELNFAQANFEAKSEANTVIENVNENESKNRNIDKESISEKDWDSAKNNFLCADQWQYQFATSKSIHAQDLKNLIAEFVNDIELREDYKNVRGLKSHFTHWYNKRKNGTHQQSPNGSNSKLGTSEARVKAARDW